MGVVSRLHSQWFIALTFFMALVLGVFPLDAESRWLRPHFVCLLIIYWTSVLPQHIGVGIAFCIGVIQDLVSGAVLGQSSLGLLIVSYLCLLSYQRFRNYVWWQQAWWVFVLVGIQQLSFNWVNSFSGRAAEGIVFLMPAAMSAVCWPVIYVFLERFRRFYRL